ncbi:FecCD family ABC transporter permease [Spirochaeta cellobiosiphila]|uniref:FecCD family ABC transporter permease n=1 Tax=Spirochaeta cellobiosiphila TaxID=504483 RepID=UPI000428AE31|nr:iron ABC transporter permease [Spirochaeta cellobiosiphila]
MIKYISIGPVSFRIKSRQWLLIIFSFIVLLVLAIWASSLGSLGLSLKEVIDGILGLSDKRTIFIVRGLRLPRILSAILVGMAFSLSGMVFQTLLKNPLASPDIVGINTGASAAVVLIIISGLSSSFIPFVAFVASMLTALLVYFLSSRDIINPLKLILVGIGFNALFTALVNYLLVKGNIHDVNASYRWMVGSLYTSNWNDIKLLLLVFPLLFLIGIIQRQLRLLQVGSQTATSIGLAVRRYQLMALILASLSSAVAVSVAGPISFVALIVPRISRMLSKAIDIGSLILCANLGAIMVLVADIFVQNVLPEGLPVGTVIAGIGAPYFLYLLIRTKE